MVYLEEYSLYFRRKYIMLLWVVQNLEMSRGDRKEKQVRQKNQANMIPEKNKGKNVSRCKGKYRNVTGRMLKKIE